MKTIYVLNCRWYDTIRKKGESEIHYYTSKAKAEKRIKDLQNKFYVENLDYIIKEAELEDEEANKNKITLNLSETCLIRIILKEYKEKEEERLERIMTSPKCYMNPTIYAKTTMNIIKAICNILNKLQP